MAQARILNEVGTDLNVILVQDEIPFNADGTALFSPGGDCTVNGVPGVGNCTDLANYIDDFTGSSGNVQKSFGNPRISVPTNQQAYYFQDSWKIRPNFTLEYGVRYEYQPADASNVFAGEQGSFTIPSSQISVTTPQRLTRIH